MLWLNIAELHFLCVLPVPAAARLCRRLACISLASPDHASTCALVPRRRVASHEADGASKPAQGPNAS